MSTDEKKSIVLQFLDALDQGNVATLASHPGLYQTVQRHPLIRAAFPDLRITVEEQIAERNTVATRATMRGTHLAPFMGAQPSNQQLTWSVLLMDEVMDGKIMLHVDTKDAIAT